MLLHPAYFPSPFHVDIANTYVYNAYMKADRDSSANSIHVDSGPISEQSPGFWRNNPPLAIVGGLMVAALAALIPAIWLDPRVLEGQAIWIKPSKFAASIALYSFTLLWILSFVQGSPRTLRRVRIAGWVIAVMFVVEIVAIFGQAARGRLSHFNQSSFEDALIFQIMGIAIAILFAAHLFVSFILLRQKNRERVLGSGLRTGMLVAALGMAVGYLMVTPNAEQIAIFAQGGLPERVGAHTVGAPDGGPGLPLTGWSTAAGDLRVAHFFGMHAMQILPLLAVFLRRGRDGDSMRNRSLVRIAGGAYAALTIALTIQALRGQALIQPDAWTLLSLALIFGAAIFAVWRSRSRDRSKSISHETESDAFA
ncbi:MAG: hypothetical protein NXI24_09970 [bacterium]|nr:hypothetical protein [bacterium]